MGVFGVDEFLPRPGECLRTGALVLYGGVCEPTTGDLAFGSGKQLGDGDGCLGGLDRDEGQIEQGMESAVSDRELAGQDPLGFGFSRPSDTLGLKSLGTPAC